MISAVRNPHSAYLRAQNWWKLIERRRPRALYGSLIEAATGSNPYLQRLQQRADDGHIVTDVLDFRMALSPHDPGLSWTLLQYGIREEISTIRFRDELRRLRAAMDGSPTVLDIGANIGYFVLIEATALGRRGEFHAIEPVPSNVELLRTNLELNDLDEAVSVHQTAIGENDSQIELFTAGRSNWHSPLQNSSHTGSITVDSTTISTFLADQDLSADSPNVLRFDLEGYEVEMFDQLAEIIAGPQPLLLFVELHPVFRSEEELVEVPRRLNENGFEIVSTTLDVGGGRFNQEWRERPAQLDSFEEIENHIRNSDAAVLLIARKGF